jgi:hypothetical protein
MKWRSYKFSYVMVFPILCWLVWLNATPSFIPSTLVGWGWPFCFRIESLPPFADTAPAEWYILALIGNCLIVAGITILAKFVIDSCISDISRMLNSRDQGNT